ncbi:hypothetical protein Pelo_13512 [Pelomyxa schiedti]|nr:hypothetical protein Pelo_13512 [Pelomyxa schiedti]
MEEVRRALSCPVCQRLLDDPVTFPCGHSACRACCPRGSQQANIASTPQVHADTPERPATAVAVASDSGLQEAGGGGKTASGCGAGEGEPGGAGKNVGIGGTGADEEGEGDGPWGCCGGRVWCPKCKTMWVPGDAPCNAQLVAVVGAFVGSAKLAAPTQPVPREFSCEKSSVLSNSSYSVPQNSTVSASAQPFFSQCDVHPEEKANLFCVYCEAVLCSICKEEEHFGHPALGIKKAAEATKNELQSLCDALTSSISGLDTILVNFDNTERFLEEEVTSSIQSIGAAFEELEENLAKRKKKLLAETASHFKDKLEVMEQRTTITTLKNELSTAADQCKKDISQATPLELLTKKKAFRACLEKLVTKVPHTIDVQIKPTTFEVCFYSHSELTAGLDLYGDLAPKARLVECDDTQQTQPGQTDSVPRFKLFGQVPAQTSRVLLIPLHEMSPFCTQHSEHPGQPRILLCTACSPQGRPGQLVCVYCSQLGDHRGHSNMQLPEAVSRTKEELTQLVSSLETSFVALTQQRKQLIEEIQAIHAETSRELAGVHAACASTILEMRQQEEKATREIKAFAEKRTSELVEKLGGLTNLIHEAAETSSLSKTLLSMHTSAQGDFLFMNTFLYFHPKFKSTLQRSQAVVPHVLVPFNFKSMHSEPNIKQELAEATAALHELKERVIALEEEKTKLNQENVARKETIETSNVELTKIQRRVTALEEERTSLQQEKIAMNEQLESSILQITRLTEQVTSSEQNYIALQVASLAFSVAACPPCWKLSNGNRTVTNILGSHRWWLALVNLDLQHCGVVRLRFYINKTLSGKVGIGFNQSGTLWPGHGGSTSGYGGCYNCETGSFSISRSNHTSTLQCHGSADPWACGTTCTAAGQEVILVFDSNAHTASFTVNGNDLGVVFTGIAEAPLFPSVAMYDTGDSVSLSAE